MKKHIATFFIMFFLIKLPLISFELELNGSYDYFRSLPDGSWNGNSGAFIAANFGTRLSDCLRAQIGGSYGIYNWDGRENLVFRNPHATLHQGFVTAGFLASYNQFHAGAVYDCQFLRHYALYDVNINIDQIRFQASHMFCLDEVGFWGTAHLRNNHKTTPCACSDLTFRAINQINLFWTHYFNPCAFTSVWAGVPYGNSLMFHHKRAGSWILGFLLRAPLTNCLFVDAHGSYMWARKTNSLNQTWNYGSNICVGLTYVFGSKCDCSDFRSMPIGNNSNFFIDTNFNQ